MPKVYLSPAYHYSNNCYFNNCYEANHNNEYIDILEPILNRCKIETKRGPRRIPLSNENGEDLMWQAVPECQLDPLVVRSLAAQSLSNQIL